MQKKINQKSYMTICICIDSIRSNKKLSNKFIKFSNLSNSLTFNLSNI